MEQFISGGFVPLAEEPHRELVLGTIGQFWRLRGGVSPEIAGAQDFLMFDHPDYAKATLNFFIEGGNGERRSRVITETRVHLLDPVTRKKFATYWRLISPASAFLRKMWLRAIKRRAEQS